MSQLSRNRPWSRVTWVVIAAFAGSLVGSAQDATAPRIEGGYRLCPDHRKEGAGYADTAREDLVRQLSAIRRCEQELRRRADESPNDRAIRSDLIDAIHCKYKLARLILEHSVRDVQREVVDRDIVLRRMEAALLRAESVVPTLSELRELDGHASAIDRFCQRRVRAGSVAAPRMIDALACLRARLELGRAGASGNRRMELLHEAISQDMTGWRRVVGRLQRVLAALAERERTEVDEVIKSYS